jgi:hypothetical protein
LFNERKQKGEIAPAPKIVKEDAKVWVSKHHKKLSVSTPNQPL